jgi:hypothetical protein
MLIKCQLNISNIAFVSEQTGGNSGTQIRGTKPLLKGYVSQAAKGFDILAAFLFSEVANWGINTKFRAT